MKKAIVVLPFGQIGKVVVMPGGIRRGVYSLQELEEGDKFIKAFPSMVAYREVEEEAKDEQPQLLNEQPINSAVLDMVEEDEIKDMQLEEDEGLDDVIEDESEEEDAINEDEVIDDVVEEEDVVEEDKSLEEIIAAFEDKKALDEFASETYNIKLNRAKKLENMKKEFWDKYQK